MRKRLDWSIRAARDLDVITGYYAEVAPPGIARLAREFIQAAYGCRGQFAPSMSC